MFTYRFRLVVGVAAVLAGGCIGKGAPTPLTTSAESEAAGPNQLQSIQVEDRGSTAGIVIQGTKSMAPNIFKLTDPNRIIVDLTDTKLGSVQGPIDVQNGGIGQITVSQFDDASTSLSRVVINLDQPTDYQVESDGAKLTLMVTKAGASSSAAEVGIPSTPPSSAPAAPEGSGAFAETQLPAPTVAEPAPPSGDAGVAAEPAPVPAAEVVAAAPTTSPAAKLIDVQYSSGDSGTDVTLVTDGSIGDYKDFLLKKPARLVVDFPGLKNGYSGKKAIPLGTREVDQLRIGRNQDNLRVVFDLAGSGESTYTVSKADTSLTLSLMTGPALAPPVAEAPFPASEAPAAEPAAPEVQAEVPMPEVEAAAVVPPPAPRRITVTGLAFKQMKEQNKSRLIIGLSAPTSDYSSREEGPGRLVVEIANSRFDKPVLQREFNTSQFQTAILRVIPSANKKEKSTAFHVELEQQVSYAVSVEGSNLYIDVDIPPQIARKQINEPQPETSSPPAVASPTPEVDHSDFMASTDEAKKAETPAAPANPSRDGGNVDLSGTREEKFMSADQFTPTRDKKVDKRPKDYRYVKEEFLSDATSSDEPLSRMGQILAGQFDGKLFSGRKISLDFKDAEIRSIFRLLADISKFNMIISDEVNGRVTIRLDNVPWDQAFAIILQTKSLWFERYGNIVRIAPADKLRQERELAAAAIRASQAAKPLDVLFKPVSYADAGGLIKQVRSVLGDRGTVDIDSRTNTLIIKDIRENLVKAKHMVEVLDTQTPQVSIEARIVEANTNYTRSFGIIWGGQARFSSATGNPSGLFFPNSTQVTGGPAIGQSFSGLPVAFNYPSPLGVNAGVGLRLGSINNILDLDLALGVLETQGHAKLISSPKITVLDNRSASIQSGSKIPFLTQTANAGSNVRFESATTSLSVTPHITNDGGVSMNISATRNEPNFAQLVQGNPLVDQRTANTEVLVKSGNTTVLGGVYSIRTGGTEDRFPGLASIPIFGWLFKNYAKELRRTELLIFVTPRIVGDEREAVRDVRG